MAKRNIKAVSDEEIIAALLQCGTVRAAAEAAGTTPRTIYDRMQDADFRTLYLEAKNDLVRSAVYSINRKLSDAVDTVATIMSNEEVNPAIRLQACQTLIANAGKFAERLDEDETRSRREKYNTERQLKSDLEWDKLFYGS